MTFITILLSLVIERYWGAVERLRHFHWFEQYCERVRQWGQRQAWLDGWIGVLLTVVPPVWLVGWVQLQLDDGWWLLLGLVFGVLILVSSIGPRDLGADARAYVHALHDEDEPAAQQHAERLLGVTPPADSAERNRMVVHALLTGLSDWLIGVLFWFFLLGPLGAAAYRLAWLVRTRCQREGVDAYGRAADQLYGVLAWLPARLTALGYAVAGSFTHGLERWRDEARRSGNWIDRIPRILSGCGLGALQLSGDEPMTPRQVKAALDLVHRSIVLWLTVIALFTLAGWAG